MIDYSYIYSIIKIQKDKSSLKSLGEKKPIKKESNGWWSRFVSIITESNGAEDLRALRMMAR